ncbi:MAG: hypothetical protein NT094_00460 [Candidatus Staskawiczbacteria bacterium]|nr:hypothetical protein [Candidatus Staskawiczbacteria bacterium]
MANPLLDTGNLKNFILSLKINPEQKKFLLDELPTLDENERLELLNTLKNVYVLNEEENQVIKKIKENWEEIEPDTQDLPD